jgi:outer membrane usher protein
VRATATGVVGYAGGRAFALQEASDAIAIVTVPGAPGITVYRENQPVARTDAEGRAVVPGLRPYDNNQLLIDANDLPISSQVRQGSMTVVPRLRGVATARFDISDSSKSSAGLRIVMPDGNLIEAGTTVRRVDHADEALVAGFSGAVWLSEPSEGERLRAPWNGGTCSVAVNGIPARGVLPDLGQRACTPDR